MQEERREGGRQAGRQAGKQAGRRCMQQVLLEEEEVGKPIVLSVVPRYSRFCLMLLTGSN